MLLKPRDEYVGLSGSQPASFRRHLKVSRIHPKTFHFVDGEADEVHEECRRVGNLIAQQPIDVAFVGIGENGHQCSSNTNTLRYTSIATHRHSSSKMRTTTTRSNTLLTI